MKSRILYVAALIFATTISFISCDDDTDTLGSDMMPNVDLVTKETKNYDVITTSYGAGDSVLARSATSYLGRFTDPETGTIVKSDFLAQFHCIDKFSFPDSVLNDSMISTEIKLLVKKYVGDSLATFKISVYPLNKVMDADGDYYTNIDPSKYYDTNAKPLTVKWFTLSDRTIEEDERESSSYNNFINIPLPREVGQQIYEAYKTHPEYFKNTEAFINSGLPCSKGVYFKLESGDGAMAYISLAQYNTDYRYYDSENDLDTTGVCSFAATEEVIQATRFENSNLDVLLKDSDATYIKSPAGIFTLATLPVDQLNHNDTINAAKFTLTRYNDKVSSNFKLDIPKYLLMVRLDDYNNGFFENYKITDSNTSYITSCNRSTNTYTFSNISHLLNTMMKEKEEGTASANYNKVLLIPVEPTFDSTSSSSSSTTLVKLCHDFSMSSAKLVGGKNPVKLEIIYTKFNK